MHIWEWIAWGIKVAYGFVYMPPVLVEITLHFRKSVLFNNGEAWFKKSGKGVFDVPRGSFDDAVISELISLCILNKINEIVYMDNRGLYRDGGMMRV